MESDCVLQQVEGSVFTTLHDVLFCCFMGASKTIQARGKFTATWLSLHKQLLGFAELFMQSQDGSGWKGAQWDHLVQFPAPTGSSRSTGHRMSWNNLSEGDWNKPSEGDSTGQ